jgi:predicted lipoprotein with Yx(FWY)xxD motif
MHRVSMTFTLITTLLAGCSETPQAATDSTQAAAAAGASTSAPTAPAAAGATVRVATDARHGTYLTDANGRALYLFEKDTPGQSQCDSACAVAWPPFLASAATAGDTLVQAAMLSTITRMDGSQQVVYNGMPLYYYVKDAAAGETKGQDIEEFGAEWYLVAPNGKKQSGAH